MQAVTRALADARLAKETFFATVAADGGGPRMDQRFDVDPAFVHDKWLRSDRGHVDSKNQQSVSQTWWVLKLKNCLKETPPHELEKPFTDFDGLCALGIMRDDHRDVATFNVSDLDECIIGMSNAWKDCCTRVTDFRLFLDMLIHRVAVISNHAYPIPPDVVEGSGETQPEITHPVDDERYMLTIADRGILTTQFAWVLDLECFFWDAIWQLDIMHNIAQPFDDAESEDLYAMSNVFLVHALLNLESAVYSRLTISWHAHRLDSLLAPGEHEKYMRKQRLAQRSDSRCVLGMIRPHTLVCADGCTRENLTATQTTDPVSTFTLFGRLFVQKGDGGVTCDNQDPKDTLNSTPIYTAFHEKRTYATKGDKNSHNDVNMVLAYVGGRLTLVELDRAKGGVKAAYYSARTEFAEADVITAYIMRTRKRSDPLLVSMRLNLAHIKEELRLAAIDRARIASAGASAIPMIL